VAATEVIFFQEATGKTPPLVEWLDDLPPKAQLKCLARLKRLEDLGHELRRPEADYLRDGVYELRASYQAIHHRMLYFFHGRRAVVVSHGLVKEREVPAREIDRAIRAKAAFEANPAAHTFKPGR
jgi:phage-related protein